MYYTQLPTWFLVPGFVNISLRLGSKTLRNSFSFTNISTFCVALQIPLNEMSCRKRNIRVVIGILVKVCYIKTLLLYIRLKLGTNNFVSISSKICFGTHQNILYLCKDFDSFYMVVVKQLHY